jgi:hypothetical protein
MNTASVVMFARACDQGWRGQPYHADMFALSPAHMPGKRWIDQWLVIAQTSLHCLSRFPSKAVLGLGCFV